MKVAALQSDALVTVSEQDGRWIFAPDEPAAGLIFYPGGEGENTAYAPLLHGLAADGVLCVLVKMPCNLAVLDMDAADGIAEKFPQIDSWYIGGHSLGGAMAAMDIKKAMVSRPSLPRNNNSKPLMRWLLG